MADTTPGERVRPWVWSPAPTCMPALAGFPAGKVVRCQYDPGQTALGWESKADRDLFITSHLCDLGHVSALSDLHPAKQKG